jgi:aminocarboxymuconate-semialdehyde decarboxylase
MNWLHFCGCGDVLCHPAGAEGSTAGPRPRLFAVDVHCHVLSMEAEALVASRPEKLAEPAAMREAMGEASVAHNLAQMLPQAFPKLTRVEQRLADMDDMGVDVQVISPSPNQYYYWADTALAREVVHVQNQSIATLCAAHPARLRGLGTVALQHPVLAAEQLEHAVRTLGLQGVEISTSVEGRELDDPALEPFWAMADRLKAVVFIHPFGTTLGTRLATHYLSNTIGQPLETTIALSRLIFSGLLDRHRCVRLLAAHGGGYLPTYLGRSEHANTVRPEARRMARKPSDYLREMYFDTVVHDSLTLRHLMDVVGPSQVLLGTDYPFDMGHYRPHELVAPDWTAQEREAVLGGNARRLFDLPRR